jgi:nitrogen fixation/metabolism regulation signal transduction histidine kinase
MSIRGRLVVMCLVVALLPAIPLTFLVKTLFDMSVDVGLNPTMEEALQSGLAVSRRHLDDMRGAFLADVQRVVVGIGDATVDSARVASAVDEVKGIGGFVVVRKVEEARAEPGDTPENEVSGVTVPRDLRPFVEHPEFRRLLENTSIIDRADESRTGYSFFETEDRSAQLAVWNPAYAGVIFRGVPGGAVSRDYLVLFYKEIDPEFLAHAGRLLDARQIFAELRLMQRSLSRSFFYPFIIIYAVCLLIALGLALLMAERLADPIRRLAAGANVVAGGDWSYRLRIKAGGETEHLVKAFNGMVSRLDAQRRRLIDMEKMAAWREMARHLAHEIKNPLLPIRLTIEELRDQYDGGDRRYKEMLDESTRVVGDELNNLQTLVKEFSWFAKMPDMDPRPGQLGQLVRDVGQMYPAVTVKFESGADVPEFPFDPDQIRRVLVNLFDNAVSVCAEGTTCAVRIALKEQGADAVLTFTDNGPGISPDRIDKIFEPYFTTRPEGTGLGLAMVKKIVLLHGGSISVKSHEGEGATFEIRLPLTGTTDAIAKD